MKTTAKARLGRLAGLLLLSLLVLAIAVPLAQAAFVSGTGAGSAPFSPPAGTQGRGGVAYAPVTQSGGGLASASGTVTPRSAGVQPTSGASSTSAWAIAGSVLGLSLIALGTWGLVRRRLQPGSAAYCSRHPSDAMCVA
jgi:hypothetical protein